MKTASEENCFKLIIILLNIAFRNNDDRVRSPMVRDLPYSGFAIFGISHGVGDHEIW